MCLSIFRVLIFCKQGWVDLLLILGEAFGRQKKRVLEGCRWRIGVGTAVNIWFDNWIPGHNALVKEGYVDFGKLRALFNPRVVEDIQKIVLCDGNGAGRLIWGHERNRVFSVRSCYKFIMAQQTSHVAESSSSRVQSVVWKWKMSVPNKIKIFAWRACKDGLPTKEKFLGKHVPTDVRCNLCHAEPEGLYHALVQCVDVQKLWADYLPVLEREKFLNVFELAFHFCTAKQFETLSTFFVLAWGIWYRRNKFIHEQALISIHQVDDHVVPLLKCYKRAKRQSRQEVRDVYKWKPPDHDVLKLNVDGAVFEDMGKASIGAILRDSSCRVLMAARALEEAIAEPEHVELLAIVHGLQFCASMGIVKIQVESDCFLAIDALLQDNMDISKFGGLYYEIKQLSSCFGECMFRHVYREANEAAHYLAKYARNVDRINMW
ncbi:hypothetical protein Patl1_32118 [Pistacia atlantica]|uniref:Uncharacterized protein n=1 Tax=Pistacia atlantica TaxID=434234 RepID=A0ACC1APX9_9ROSI|nr:hypothetical protein Patl1_32118 [Pistacia atlantica]